MTDSNDWVPAKKLAALFFDSFGTLGEIKKQPLWDGKILSASTPSNLIHEVAHFQIAPAWRRYKPGYGLGFEPEGQMAPPRIVSCYRAQQEESLASLLGIFWEARFGYPWAQTAMSHTWGTYPNYLKTTRELFDVSQEVGKKLISMGLLSEGLEPQPILADSWRADSFDCP